MTPLLLTPAEARVIAALTEKSIATPQYYPMTVNAIMLACNQKSCRDPVMQLREGEVGAALLDLQDKGLAARDDQGSRVPKWRQSFQHHLLLQPPALAVLLTLMLRGPQTLSELRSNGATLGGPTDADGVERVLADLIDRAQPLVVLLPRAPGRKEARYAHTLCGPPEMPAVAEPVAAPTSAPVGPYGRDRNALAELEQRLRELEARVAALEAERGSARGVPPADPAALG
jgi:uncharacterized protein YceH (UPF0502 family)